MQAEDPITEGEVWRGIGPAIPPPGRSAPYDLRDEDGRAIAHFSSDAFYDQVRTDPHTGLRTQEPSVLLAGLAGQPVQAQTTLRAAGLPCSALAGIAVPAILAATARTSQGAPTAAGTGSTPMMLVVFDPCTVTNRETQLEVRLDAHAVVRPQPRWHSTRGPLKAMLLALAALATDHHRRHGWALAPAA
jgi:hypothetical protein